MNPAQADGAKPMPSAAINSATRTPIAPPGVGPQIPANTNPVVAGAGSPAATIPVATKPAAALVGSPGTEAGHTLAKATESVTATPLTATGTITSGNAAAANATPASSGPSPAGPNPAATTVPAFAQAPAQPAPASGQNSAAPNKPAAGVAKATATGKTTASASASGQPTATAAARTSGEPVDPTPLRQRGGDTPTIQTASSLAARPSPGSQGGAPTFNAAPGSTSPANPSASAATGAAGASATNSDPAAVLAATKDALPTAAQSGAPITPLPAALGEAQAQQAARLDGASLDAAVQADADFNLSRLEGRMAADRTGSQLHRFTPHTTTQLAGQITKHVSNGNRVFDIRLDPAELGKVDVRIELRADNRVHAVLTVERPETLNELQRSARDLERSLAEAGLELDEDGLSFQMNDGQDPAGDDDRDTGDALPVFTQTNELARRAEDELSARPRSAYGFLLSGRTGVDVQV